MAEVALPEPRPFTPQISNLRAHLHFTYYCLEAIERLWTRSAPRPANAISYMGFLSYRQQPLIPTTGTDLPWISPTYPGYLRFTLDTSKPPSQFQRTSILPFALSAHNLTDQLKSPQHGTNTLASTIHVTRRVVLENFARRSTCRVRIRDTSQR